MEYLVYLERYGIPTGGFDPVLLYEIRLELGMPTEPPPSETTSDDNTSNCDTTTDDTTSNCDTTSDDTSEYSCN